jgi:hypothetical protein
MWVVSIIALAFVVNAAIIEPQFKVEPFADFWPCSPACVPRRATDHEIAFHLETNIAFIPTDKSHVLIRYDLTNHEAIEWYRDDINSRFASCIVIDQLNKVACADEAGIDEDAGIARVHIFNSDSLAAIKNSIQLKTGTQENYLGLLDLETETSIVFGMLCIFYIDYVVLSYKNGTFTLHRVPLDIVKSV